MEELDLIDDFLCTINLILGVLLLINYNKLLVLHILALSETITVLVRSKIINYYKNNKKDV